jgi:hypothetical protein
MENFINITLKRYRCIYEFKENNQEFKKKVLSSDGHFPYIFILYLNGTIGISNVDSGNVFHVG